MYTIRFYDDTDDDRLLHETSLPLGSPLPRKGDTVEFHDLLWDVHGIAFEYRSDGEAPVVILRVDHF